MGAVVDYNGEIDSLENFLHILKYSSLVFGSFSAIWGVTRKITYDDLGGVKRLTFAGKISIALTLVSLFIGATTQSFEIIIKAQKDREQVRSAQQQELENKRRDSLAEATKALVCATKDLVAARTNLISVQIKAQKILTLSLASAERQRQMQLSQQVQRGSMANLEKTRAALDQIERVLDPAGTPSFVISWKLNGPVIKSKFLEEKIEFAQKYYVEWYHDYKPGTAFLQGTSPEMSRAGSIVVKVQSDSEIFPLKDKDPDIFDITKDRVYFIFIKNDDFEKAINAINNSSDETILIEQYHKADYAFRTGSLGASDVKYDQDGSMVFDYKGEPDQFELAKTGKIFAVKDFEDSGLIIYMGKSIRTRGESRRLLPERLELKIAGRYYVFGYDEFRKVDLGNAGVAFVLRKIGKPDK